MIQAHLDLRAIKKTLKYSGKTKYEFGPLVLSTSGTVHTRVAQWFASLRKLGADLSDLYKDLSVILLKNRALGFLFH